MQVFIDLLITVAGGRRYSSGGCSVYHRHNPSAGLSLL